MKYITFFTLITAFTFSASAARKLGSECGLKDSLAGTDVHPVGAVLSIDSSTPVSKIAKLPTLTKQQLIITAKYFLKTNGETTEINNTEDAINYLSGSDGINVNRYIVKKSRITQVTYYPGENPYSVIFLSGTTHVIAYGEDDTIYCR